MNETSRALLRTVVDADSSLSENERELLERILKNGEPLPLIANIHGHQKFIRGTQLMVILGYKNRAAFWQFVRRSAFPHVRLNSRSIIFEQRAVKDWLDRHSSSYGQKR